MASLAVVILTRSYETGFFVITHILDVFEEVSVNIRTKKLYLTPLF